VNEILNIKILNTKAGKKEFLESKRALIKEAINFPSGTLENQEKNINQFF